MLYTPIESMTADYVEQRTEVISDPYKKVSIVSGPIVGGLLVTSYQLSCGVRKESACWITIGHDADSWAFLEQAHDREGLALKLADRPERKVLPNGRTSETLQFDLPSGYLDQHAKTGIDIRVDGSRGGIFVKFSPAYLEGFLAALARAKGGGLLPTVLIEPNAQGKSMLARTTTGYALNAFGYNANNQATGITTIQCFPGDQEAACTNTAAKVEPQFNAALRTKGIAGTVRFRCEAVQTCKANPQIAPLPAN
jgi:hypothetical protein